MAKIMLVEDDDNLREIYEARLLAEGYDIVTAKNGEDALVVAKENHPDLIISDVMMPNISGFDMLDILRNTQGMADVKVIMLTALSQADDKTRAEKLGADRYLVKSQVTLEDIVNTSAELLNGDAAPAAAPQPEIALPPVAAPVVAPEPAPAPAAPTVVAPTPAPAPAPAVPAPQPIVDVTPPVATAPVAPAAQAPVAPAAQPAAPSAPINTAPAITPAPTPAPAVPAPQPIVDVTPPVATAPAVPALPPVAPTREPVVAPATEPVATPAPVEAAPQAASPEVPPAVATTVASVPVAVAPEEPSEEPETPIISMPKPEPDDVIAKAISSVETKTTEPAAEPEKAAPTEAPIADTPTAQAPTPPAEQTTESNAEETKPEEEIKSMNVQSSTSEEAAMQQQIDSFVSNSPISTPEFDPTKIETAEPEPSDNPPAPSSAEISQQVQQADGPPPPPIAPSVEPAAVVQPTPVEVIPPAPATGTAPGGAAEPPKTAPFHSNTTTGGNKVIHPLPASEKPQASLDELLAKEGGGAPAATVVTLPGMPPTAISQPGAVAGSQATVFDPDDPSSVSL